MILHDEINVREQRKIARRTAAAEFTALKQLEDFDWRFNSSVSRKEIYELAACHFVRKAVRSEGVVRSDGVRPFFVIIFASLHSSAIPPY